MEIPIVVALISGTFVIAAPIITYIITKQYEMRFLQPINKSRGKALKGHWKGNIAQHNGTFEIELSIDITGRQVIGNARISKLHDSSGSSVHLDLKGGFHYERFLKLDYTNSDYGIIQFGSMTLELDDYPKKMSGKYSGYGWVSRAIISGSITVEKNCYERSHDHTN